eukprot:CAMPEP_0185723238 /NCGR_PEP_ID=MMETSP1171-20130828/149_1 /TAXON_ID=374046 /ORGANISM="Helicotheca tamensis, Strain CCMP826" /LENGTH=200 /DNA_ID=CAMNT_0028390907 /DNA_START=98 /DNA_END=700 /DNA_ORIENTATION=+
MKFIAITSMFVSVSVATAKTHLRSLTNAPSGPFDCGDNNPCVPLLNEGQFYYPSFAAHKFVQCSEYGDCDVMPCPTDEVWSVEAYTCIWSPIPSSMPSSSPTISSMPSSSPTSTPSSSPSSAPSSSPSSSPTSTPTSMPTEDGFDCDNKNPCDPLFTPFEYYYPYVEEDKFVQCDAHGGCYVRPCPEIDEVWDKDLKTCV